jgi:hypothetical protein
MTVWTSSSNFSPTSTDLGLVRSLSKLFPTDDLFLTPREDLSPLTFNSCSTEYNDNNNDNNNNNNNDGGDEATEIKEICIKSY